MKEVFDLSFSLVNLIPSALLVFILIYWLSVIVGVIDLNFFDIDVDVHADFDVDAGHVDALAADTQISVGWLNAVLAFFNLGYVPFMVFLSFVILPMWLISVVLNYYIGNNSFLIGLVLLIPNFIFSLFIAKFATIPFIKIFKKLDNEMKTNENLIGKTCEVVLPVSSKKIGQVEVMHNNSPIRLNAITVAGVELLKGETALVIDYLEDKQVYLVEPYKN